MFLFGNQTDIYCRGRTSLTNHGIRTTFEPLNMPYDMIILFVVPSNELTLQIIYIISSPPPKKIITDSSQFRILKKLENGFTNTRLKTPRTNHTQCQVNISCTPIIYFVFLNTCLYCSMVLVCNPKHFKEAFYPTSCKL